jgi:shikimate kinase
MLIFLIGMMGSGKTAIGKLLAEAMGLPFFDTDEIISNLEGMSISTIFDRKGETYFRQAECELISQWKITDAIVATGGGLPCYNDVMGILNSKGKTVWIQVGADKLTARIIKGSDKRPLIKGKTPQEITSVIKKLAKERKPFYQQAQIKIRSEEEKDQTVRKILKKLY